MAYSEGTPSVNNNEGASTISLYTKAIGTLVVTALTSYISAVEDNGNVTAPEWITIVISTLVATSVVWAVPSTSEKARQVGKSVTAAIVAFLSSLAVGLTDGGLAQPEVITAVVAGLTALGFVGVAKNAASNDPVSAAKRYVPVSTHEKRAAVADRL